MNKLPVLDAARVRGQDVKNSTLGEGRAQARTTEAWPQGRLGVSLVHSTEEVG